MKLVLPLDSNFLHGNSRRQALAKRGPRERDMTINRRSLLASGAALIAAGASGKVQAQGAPPELRFSAVFSEADIRAEMMKRFTEAVKSDFTVKSYLGGNLFKQ